MSRCDIMQSFYIRSVCLNFNCRYCYDCWILRASVRLLLFETPCDHHLGHPHPFCILDRNLWKSRIFHHLSHLISCTDPHPSFLDILRIIFSIFSIVLYTNNSSSTGTEHAVHFLQRLQRLGETHYASHCRDYTESVVFPHNQCDFLLASFPPWDRWKPKKDP